MSHDPSLLYTRFPLLNHAKLLADDHRFQVYKRAVHAIVRHNDKVVDLGAGIGVLSAIACEATTGSVIALEANQSTAAIAGRLLAGSHATVIARSSFQTTLPCEPDVFLSELMGHLGIDEGIVEACHDFVARHPSIRTVVPYQLHLFAQVILSPLIEEEYHLIHDTYRQTIARMPHPANDLLDSLEQLYGSIVRTSELSPVQPRAEPQLLFSAHLGSTQSSHFDTYVSCGNADGNAIHLYFVASLASDLSLDTHIASPLTHWQHVWLRRPRRAQTCHFRYDGEARRLRVHWA